MMYSVSMKIFTAITLVIASVTGIVWQNGFSHQVLLMGIGIYLWMPLLVLSTLVGLVFWGRGHQSPWLERLWGILGVVGAGLFISWGVGSLTYRWQSERVSSFIARAQLELDAEKTRTGSYPAVLPPKLEATLPAWLNHPDAYRSSGKTFEFTCLDPGELISGGKVYSSETREWMLVD